MPVVGVGRRTVFADRAVDKRVGSVLREVRDDAGLSLGKVQAATDGAVKASVLGAYERGERSVSIDRLLELARLYAVPPDVLLSVIERRCQS